MKKIIIALPLLLCGEIFAEPATPVTTQKASELLSFIEYSAPATIVALNTPQIAAQVTGLVLSLPVKIGDEVKKNDLIAELDCRIYESQMKASSALLSHNTAKVRFAQKQLSRANNLKKKSSISKELFEQRQTDLKLAQANQKNQAASLEQSQINTQHCKIF